MPERLSLNVDALRCYFGEQTVESGKRLRERRKALGLTLGDVAGIVGVSMQTVSMIERARFTPRDYLKAALAIGLAVEVSDIWPMPNRATLARLAA